MSRPGQLATTRMALLQARRRAARVAKGIDLLRTKREALVRRLFELARPAAEARARSMEQGAEAYAALLSALAAHGEVELRALSWPERGVTVSIGEGQIWGVDVVELAREMSLHRSLVARGTPPASIGPAALEAARAFEELAELLIESAARELPVRRIADAVARTTRQVNVLERRVVPSLRAQIASVKRALDEREREEHLRLRRVLSRRRP